MAKPSHLRMRWRLTKHSGYTTSDALTAERRGINERQPRPSVSALPGQRQASYACPVQSRIIDGEQWIAGRLAFLREHLKTDLTDPERAATEAEIQRLLKAPALSCTGLTGGGLRPRLRRRNHSRANPDAPNNHT